MSHAEGKQPVLVRLPLNLFSDYLKQSAVATVGRGKSVSVPKLIVENLLVMERIKKLVMDGALSPDDKLEQIAGLFNTERKSE